MIIAFFIAFMMNSFVVLSFAEICSAYPKNGSVYYWSINLA